MSTKLEDALLLKSLLDSRGGSHSSFPEIIGILTFATILLIFVCYVFGLLPSQTQYKEPQASGFQGSRPKMIPFSGYNRPQRIPQFITFEDYFMSQNIPRIKY